MSGNRQPFRVGPVREAYWDPSSPQLPGLAWGGEPGGGKNRKKEEDCPIGFSHITPPHVYYFGV